MAKHEPFGILSVVTLLVAILLSGCEWPGERTEAFKDKAHETAATVEPDAMRVVESRLRGTRDAGRTVRLDYRADGYAFPIILGMAQLTETGPQMCDLRMTCEESMRQQIERWKRSINLQRHLDETLQQCGASFEPAPPADIALEKPGLVPRVFLGLHGPPRISVSLRVAEVVSSESGSSPARPDELIERLDACTATIEDAHTNGPEAALPFGIEFFIPLERVFLKPDHYVADEVFLHYQPRLAEPLRKFSLRLPSAAEFEAYYRWGELAGRWMRERGNPGRTLPAPAKSTLVDAKRDPFLMRIHFIWLPEGSDLPPWKLRDAVRLRHDLRTGETLVECFVFNLRGADGKRDEQRLSIPCDEASRR